MVTRCVVAVARFRQGRKHISRTFALMILFDATVLWSPRLDTEISPSLEFLMTLSFFFGVCVLFSCGREKHTVFFCGIREVVLNGYAIDIFQRQDKTWRFVRSVTRLTNPVANLQPVCLSVKATRACMSPFDATTHPTCFDFRCAEHVRPFLLFRVYDRT